MGISRFSHLPVVPASSGGRIPIQQSDYGVIPLSSSSGHRRLSETLCISLEIKNTLDKKGFIYHFYFSKYVVISIWVMLSKKCAW